MLSLPPCPSAELNATHRSAPRTPALRRGKGEKGASGCAEALAALPPYGGRCPPARGSACGAPLSPPRALPTCPFSYFRTCMPSPLPT